jgi:hypothetical protein
MAQNQVFIFNNDSAANIHNSVKKNIQQNKKKYSITFVVSKFDSKK